MAAGFALVYKDYLLWRVCLNSGQATLLGEHCLHHLAISGDGKSALCHGVVRVYDCEQRLLSQVQVPNALPSWSPDGEALALMKDDFELWLIDRVGAAPRLLVRLLDCADEKVRMSSYSTRPAWSADGRYLWTGLTWNRRKPAFMASPAGHPGNEFDYVHLSVLVDLSEARVEVWPGRHFSAVFNPWPTDALPLSAGIPRANG